MSSQWLVRLTNIGASGWPVTRVYYENERAPAILRALEEDYRLRAAARAATGGAARASVGLLHRNGLMLILTQ